MGKKAESRRHILAFGEGHQTLTDRPQSHGDTQININGLFKIEELARNMLRYWSNSFIIINIVSV